jgi:hypothetical protein
MQDGRCDLHKALSTPWNLVVLNRLRGIYDDSERDMTKNVSPSLLLIVRYLQMPLLPFA